ncbi:MAG: spore coat protein [Legionellales bacterium RIFCSPHIGHO2_12_FULL_37_14]|nr:MAG: spore coat protein [Legionellales bacterium RIFCSPHIGHO2_12_FULL_37_14]
MFKGLFIFEIANNHNGSVEHGCEIIRSMAKISQEFPFQFAVKLQYRNLDTFIHPDYRDQQDIKYVKRFRETELKEPSLLELKKAISSHTFTAICTPFDEDSVGWIEQHGFDILKVASCSITDWPLLERIALSPLPVIASTAGASLDEIDQVVAFFRNRKKTFALMHCIAKYPTPLDDLQLGQIALLKERYADIPIGYSTHEHPDEVGAIKMAIAYGATLFEKHVGMGELNAYSANPTQVETWLRSAQDAFRMTGSKDERTWITNEEIDTLNALRRGVFAKKVIRSGESLNSSNTFFAIPSKPGQLLANSLSKYCHFTVKEELPINAPLLFTNLVCKNIREDVLEIMSRVIKVLNDSKVIVPDGASCQISHHFGIENFSKFGAVIIDVVNREYCKKLIVLLPGQKHPVHQHRKKEETFHVLYGSMRLQLNGQEQEVSVGELVTIERGVAHAFETSNGVIFEELSTTHYVDDSFYCESNINANKDRKTQLLFRSSWLQEELK